MVATNTAPLISTHAPREGSDVVTAKEQLGHSNFNPRSPRGERRTAAALPSSSPKFQPALPARGATVVAAQGAHPQQISTRAPREGSDSKYLQVLKSRTQQYRQTLHRITTKTALFPVQKRIFSFEPPSISTFFSANLPENICALVLRTSQYQGFLRHVRLFAAKVLDLVLVPLAQIVKSQAVLFCVHDRQEFCLERFALGGVQQALKDGVLHPLPVVDTLLCDLPQATAPGGRLRCLHHR